MRSLRTQELQKPEAMSEVLDVVKPQAQSSGRETTIKAMTQNGRRLDSDRQRQDL